MSEQRMNYLIRIRPIHEPEDEKSRKGREGNEERWKWKQMRTCFLVKCMSASRRDEPAILERGEKEKRNVDREGERVSGKSQSKSHDSFANQITVIRTGYPIIIAAVIRPQPRLFSPLYFSLSPFLSSFLLTDHFLPDIETEQRWYYWTRFTPGWPSLTSLPFPCLSSSCV